MYQYDFSIKVCFTFNYLVNLCKPMMTLTENILSEYQKHYILFSTHSICCYLFLVSVKVCSWTRSTWATIMYPLYNTNIYTFVVLYIYIYTPHSALTVNLPTHRFTHTHTHHPHVTHLTFLLHFRSNISDSTYLYKNS